mmetsp:Transcript_44849/g.74444  ORF Transcript_44849/g.74444 Transcript_44849/m.74444 type:complete len:116 (-) Transcript_44849:291-638(-)
MEGSSGPGPEPRKILGLIYNSKQVAFWGIMLFLPPFVLLACNGFKLSMSREELMKTETMKRQIAQNRSEDRYLENKENMNRVLFETKAPFRAEWAIKRDQKNEQERLEREVEQRS